MKEIKGFTTFHLKIIALVLMVIDHIGEFLPGMPGWLRYVGRLSAPLFFFCMCWGLEYTKNRKRYLLRLYLASVAMALLWCGLEIVFPFFAGYGPAYSAYNENNIFSTLFITAVFITILTRFKGWKRACLFSGVLLWEFAVGYLMVFGSLPETLSLPPVLVSAFLGSLFTCEGGCFACLLGILLYFLKNGKRKLAIGYAAWCLIVEVYLRPVQPVALWINGLYEQWAGTGQGDLFFTISEWIYTLFTGNPPGAVGMGGWPAWSCQWMEIGALPFMLLYNREKGRSWKWFFYVFYPLHFAVLFIIGSLFA